MDKSERDELEAAARAALSEQWCLHPNGTSVWTGEEYQIDAPQFMVCKVYPIGEIEVRRMEFIATCNPHAVLELLEFYGLSDTVLEKGVECDAELCAVCYGPTTEGHTHADCFAYGKEAGMSEENIACAVKLAEALGIEYHGEPFDEVIKIVERSP